MSSFFKIYNLGDFIEGRHCLGAANQSLLLLLQNSSNNIAQSANCNGSAAPYLSAH